MPSGVYRNNLKNRGFDKEASQNSHLERATIVRAQGASEDENFEKKPTQSKTDSSGCFGIILIPRIGLNTPSGELKLCIKASLPEGRVQKCAKSSGRQTLEHRHVLEPCEENESL